MENVLFSGVQILYITVICSLTFEAIFFSYENAMPAASQLPGRGPTDVDIANVPAC